MNEERTLLEDLQDVLNAYESEKISKKELIKTLKTIVLFEEKFIDNPYTSVSAVELMERYKDV